MKAIKLYWMFYVLTIINGKQIGIDGIMEPGAEHVHMKVI